MKFKKHLFFLVLLSLTIAISLAQSQFDYWPIDREVLLKYSSGSLEFYDTVSIGSYEYFPNDPCHVAFNDIYGNLLLYGSQSILITLRGDTIHRLANPSKAHLGWNQGTLLLPIEEDDSEETKITKLLFIYTLVDSSPTTPYLSELFYRVIDLYYIDEEVLISISDAKKLMSYNSRRRLQGIRHANGDDWWLVSGGSSPTSHSEASDSFWVAHFRSDSIVESFIQRIGTLCVGSQLAVSQDGSQIAHAGSSVVELFDFNRCTGKLSNARIIEDSVYGHYGCAFSSDGSKLYVSTHIPKLLQYDLSTPDFAKTELLSGVGSGQSNFYEATQLQRGPDNKIYMGFRKFGFWPYPYGEDPSQYLMAVTNPNAAGADVVLDTFAVWLGGFYNRSYGLPNFVNHNLGSMEGSDCDSTGGGSTFVENPGEIRSDWQVQPTVSSGLYVFSGPINTNLAAYDVWGRLVWRDRYSGSGIDLSAIPPGLYLLHASSESQQQMFKIIRQ